MSDTFRIQEAITFVQQTPPETYRLLDVTINNIPVAYNNGKVLLAAATTDLKVADEVNIFILNCSTGVTLKVGASTNPAIENVTHFSYKGAKTDFYLSNTETEDITVSIATCSL